VVSLRIMSHRSRFVRKIGWFLVGDVALILFLFVFGVLLRAMRIPVDRHPFLTEMLGQHGVVFNFVLPLAFYSLIPVTVIWVIAWIVSRFMPKNDERSAVT
jgi:uncharacterized membrane protein YjfL (UPF0719 family)